jgi:hypothetical protein
MVAMWFSDTDDVLTIRKSDVSRNGFCFIKTGSVLLQPILFYCNRFCFIETGSVLLKPVLFWSSEKG